MHSRSMRAHRIRCGSLTRRRIACGAVESKQRAKQTQAENIQDQTGVSMGPISLSFAESQQVDAVSDDELVEMVKQEKQSMKSIHSMSTQQWREKYETDGMVDLWVEEEFNAGSRLKGGRMVHQGGTYGQKTGEGPSLGATATHNVVINDRRGGKTVAVEIPEDRYILWEAEDAGLELPFACRMGCCTACAVRVKSGAVWQPEALGISRELKDKNFALMCVGFPQSDVELETVEEDELYMEQFGKPFAELAVDKDSIFIDRDDFALELAEMDE